jgi:hypothetical protein
MNSPAVRSDHLLSFSAPTMIAGVEILAGVSRDAVQHEELFRTERPAERRSDCYRCVYFRIRDSDIICLSHLRYSSWSCALAFARGAFLRFDLLSLSCHASRFCKCTANQRLRERNFITILFQRLRPFERQARSFRKYVSA